MDLLNHLALTIFMVSSVFYTSFSEEIEGHSANSSCSYPELCSEATKCCQFGVDEDGWIAAAVGWSLWFLTLILLCINKLMNLRPDEPKYLGA